MSSFFIAVSNAVSPIALNGLYKNLKRYPPPNCEILDNLTFENFILTDELFAKGFGYIFHPKFYLYFYLNFYPYFSKREKSIAFYEYLISSFN